MNIQNQQEWIKATKDASGRLRTKHGFADDLFHVVTGDDIVHLPHHDYYPEDWESETEIRQYVRTKQLVKRDCIPEGLVLFVMPESQCNCFNCSGNEAVTVIYKDPIMMLEGVEAWETNTRGKFK